MQSAYPPILADEPEYIEIIGANEHNLKNVNVCFPRNSLVVITGVSGSGKSSLAFDTLFAEGQRRYLESFSTYARQFLGNLSKPKVEAIHGLSPSIAIEQKTTSKSPRSTVGTITEIYDFLRLLFARTSTAYSYETGEVMVSFTSREILNRLTNQYINTSVVLLAPLVKGRKGHYRELFEKLGKQGFSKVRVDGELIPITKGMQLDRYKVHDIELLVDRLKVENVDKERLSASLNEALKIGAGAVLVLDQNAKAHYFSLELTCPSTGIAYKAPEPNLFSFNSPYGACSRCKGLGYSLVVDEQKVIPNKHISIKNGAILPLGRYKNTYVFNQIETLSEKYQVDLSLPFCELSDEFTQVLLFGEDQENELHPFLGILEYLNQINEFNESGSVENTQFYKEETCKECKGNRLNKEALHFKIGGKNISEVAQLDLADLKTWCLSVPALLEEHKKYIATEILKEVEEKIDFLLEVGLYYLSLDRTAKTLSGGESQRIRLSAQIGAKLVGVLYILDEPSIGLHPSDNRKMISALQKLRDNGNSVLVVEHDKEIMEHSDFIIDVGPRAGVHGGRIIDAGKPSELKNVSSFTYQYLNGINQIKVPEFRRKGNGNKLILKGAKGHNLKNVQLNLPLGTLICVTGVSGSGKSSLINGTLSPLLFNHVYQTKQVPLVFEEILGKENIDKVIEINQAPIGRSPRSNPITYTGVFSDIRNLFAQLPQAKALGYSAGKFSFNVVGGRCEECKGAGFQTIEMNFLPDVQVLCKACNGKRYKNEVLKLRYRSKNIYDVLEMPVAEAVEFFQHYPSIHRKLKVLDEVGLSYIKLGQSSLTLSGGEAQRIKLGAELHKKDTGKTIYLLDEPTTGLHFEDIKMLLSVMNRMVDKGNTILVIEHNLDVIKSSDYVVDLGPEGGKKGGNIIAQGTPEEVSKNKASLTGKFILEELKSQKNESRKRR